MSDPRLCEFVWRDCYGIRTCDRKKPCFEHSHPQPLSDAGQGRLECHRCMKLWLSPEDVSHFCVSARVPYQMPEQDQLRGVQARAQGEGRTLYVSCPQCGGSGATTNGEDEDNCDLCAAKGYALLPAVVAWENDL